MHLHCESCGTPIQADDMNLATALAKCRACHAVMSFAARLGARPPAALAALSAHLAPQAAGAAGGQPVASAAGPRPRAPRPEHVQVRDDGGAVSISSRWFSRGDGFLVIFCLFWDGFLAFWYFTAFAANGPLMMKVFPLLHVAAGVGVTYVTAARVLNRTVVRADRERVTVRHGPVPWPGGQEVASPEVEQLYCQPQRPSVRGTGIPGTVFDVMALLTDNRKLTLLPGVHDRDHALFVEQTLEDYLGIRDRPVTGELPR